MTRNNRILFLLSLAAALSPALAVRAVEWPRIPGQGTDWVNSLNEPQWPSIAEKVERRFPSPWAFEVGARYWYSTGTTKFGFSNGAWPYGSPTSTIDWKQTEGHAGEIFGRIDHRPSNVFVKAVAGAGILRGGEMIDRDYLLYQYTFSDTTSEVSGNNLRYATIDVGYSYEVPRYGVKVGGFVGYHYWHEKTTGYGVICNTDDYAQYYSKCTPGAVEVPFGTAVMTYEPTWHAVRLGMDARFRVNQRWSVSGEAAFIPIAWLDNKDSHLLRQSMSDLGPAPNVISKGSGWGGMAEAFVNYEVTPNLEASLGIRYWGLNTLRGTVNAGPWFNQDYKLDYFDQSRWGLLAQLKGKF